MTTNHTDNGVAVVDNYFISPKALYKVLTDKGVKFFYHANTVLTSLTFIKQRALLSRSYVEGNGLVQTPQKSDPEDKKYNVWDDVFLDGLDLHQTYRQSNRYGPVTFVLNLKLLLSPSTSNVLVTKNNPMYWKDSDSLDDKYYSDAADIIKDYMTGGLDSRIMFTLRSPGGSIKLKKFLHNIVVDKPNVIISFKSGERNVGDIVKLSLQEALAENGLRHIKVTQRHSEEKISLCKCSLEYTAMWNFKNDEFLKRFRTKL